MYSVPVFHPLHLLSLYSIVSEIFCVAIHLFFVTTEMVYSGASWCSTVVSVVVWGPMEGGWEHKQEGLRSSPYPLLHLEELLFKNKIFYINLHI